MRVYISCDLEGITGVVKESQLQAGGEGYERARKIMTKEVNAAAGGAFEAGASVVVVNDAHDKMDNILIENLQDNIELISGNPKKFSMMEGIWSGFDVCFFLGYHSMRSKRGVISHTYSSSLVLDVKINEVSLGETGINAMIAGYYDVPVGLVSGDDILHNETREILGEEVKFVETKKALTKYSAWHHPLNNVYDQLRSKSKEVIEHIDRFKPFKVSSPIKLEVRFADISYADQALMLPRTFRPNLSSPIVTYEAHDVIEFYKAFRTMLVLANTG
ncbi:M55 family metallopeptidase [Natranaerofaba carboxydovora]|uniref:M55 family metallopeptidase n=1 Tax=Natranaerofaba carboxydovora TaxID=2742683 RepID=UPI001F14560F|nr:M55 family metallopeptidase [Natranaerofaba carboxydovora]UMZ74879.1 D-aminopeptidase [Natranaerofaba carboxydovora]